MVGVGVFFFYLNNLFGRVRGFLCLNYFFDGCLEWVF